MTEQDQKAYSAELSREQLRERMLRMPANALIAMFVDIDETLIATVPYIRKLVNRLLLCAFGVDAARLPTLEEMNAKGGSSGVYPQFFGSPESFESVMDFVRGHRGVNVRPGGLVPGIGEHVSRVAMDERVSLLGSITARPALGGVVAATQYQLFQKIGLPTFPILARPISEPIERTSAWKIQEMKEIAKLRPEKQTVIVDDNAGLVSAIRSYNQQRSAGDPRLVQIVYPGPLTIGKIERGELQDDPEHGIYIGNDWEHMLSTIARVIAGAAQ